MRHRLKYRRAHLPTNAQVQATSDVLKSVSKTTDKGVLICVIDSGIDASHPEFAGGPTDLDGCKEEDAEAPAGCPFKVCVACSVNSSAGLQVADVGVQGSSGWLQRGGRRCPRRLPLQGLYCLQCAAWLLHSAGLVACGCCQGSN